MFLFLVIKLDRTQNVDSPPRLTNYITRPMSTCGIELNFRPNCGLSLKCITSHQTVKVRLATVIVACAFDTPLYRTCLCSMSCAQSLTLIFSDNGRFDYFRFSYVLAALSCTCIAYATSVNFERLVLLPIRNYCQFSISV